MGYGTAGRFFHSPLLHAEPSTTVVAIVTSHPERIEHAHQDHPEAQVFASMEGLMDAASRLDLDLVVIASANSMHVEQGLTALAAGLHVVVDKPLAGTAPDAHKLLAGAHHSLLTVFHNRRWDSDFLSLQHVLEQGLLGAVHRFESRIERWRPRVRGGWRESGNATEFGGLLLDVGSHLVDQAMQLFGPVEQVLCTTKSIRDPLGPEDDFCLTLEHSNGVSSHLSATAVAAAPGPRLRALGTSGTFVVHGFDVQEMQLRSGMSPLDSEFGVPQDEPMLFLDPHHVGEAIERKAQVFKGDWNTFYRKVTQAIEHNEPLPVLASDAVETLRVLDAARESATTQRVVTLVPHAHHN